MWPNRICDMCDMQKTLNGVGLLIYLGRLDSFGFRFLSVIIAESSAQRISIIEGMQSSPVP